MRWTLRKLNNGPKQIHDLLKGYLASCLKMTQYGDSLQMPPMLVIKKKMNTIKKHDKNNNVR